MERIGEVGIAGGFGVEPRGLGEVHFGAKNCKKVSKKCLKVSFFGLVRADRETLSVRWRLPLICTGS